MVKKAQAEFIIIVGIVALALVVAYYASQPNDLRPSNVPEAVFEKQKAVHESLLAMARKGADKTLSVMETHGGYPTAELLGNGTYDIQPFVVFLDEGVPYWARCQSNLAPSKKDIAYWFRLSMENYIREHITEITGTYRNASFDLSRLSVSVNILNTTDKIEITINLPTKVEGYSLQSPLYPYKASLDTKLGEIYDFAADFSKAQSSKRFLEVFTTASIYMSKDAEDGYAKLPTGGFMTNCGETIYRTPDQISAYLKEIAEYVLTQILWWQNMPVDPSKPKVYAINREIMGREYRDLEISMYLPDGFSFDTRGAVVITNDEPAYTSMFWSAPDCLGGYSMSYAISYPAIVRVKDPLSGYSFNFAVYAFVDNSGGKMQPGKCEDVKTGEDICKQAGCSAKIKVTDESGNPIAGAVATFGECGIGTSDSSGTIEGKIKCGNRKLNIFRNSSYDFFNQNVSSSAINGTYVLRSLANFTANFNRVTITEQGVYTKCVIGKPSDLIYLELASGGRMFTLTNIDPESVSESCTSNQSCLDECQRTLNIDLCTSCAASCIGGFLDSVNIGYIPADVYDANATMMSLGMMKETGGFITSYALKSTAKNIYIHVPETATPDYKLSDSQKLALAQKLRECRIEPISENPYPKTTYLTSCTCGNLKAIWDDVKTRCTPALDSMFCTCPIGSSYPSGCGQGCGDLPCDTCCDLGQINQLIKSWASNCSTRVICQ